MEVTMQDASSSKVPKRKRLAKACDGCHKSKRRCDGTAPCSNCFYAQKECSYTDSAGRPVPAPRATRGQPQASTSTAEHRPSSPCSVSSSSSASARVSVAGPIFAVPAAAPSFQHAKRPRIETSFAHDPEPPSIFVLPARPPRRQQDCGAVLDPAHVRELAALFFAHIYPSRLIFHAPSFGALLSQGKVPAFLVHSVCACAAPLSPHRPQGSAPRAAGMEHAIAAKALLLNDKGELRDSLGKGVEVAQALCLLMHHEHVAAFPWKPSVDSFDLATQLLNDHLLHNPTLSPTDAEIARRCAWFIRYTYITGLQYHSVPTPPQAGPDHSIPLPRDEMSFEMVIAGGPFEHMHDQRLPEKQSEFAHVLRTAEMHYTINDALSAYDAGRLDRAGLQAAASDTKRDLTAWAAVLSPSMQFATPAVEAHLALFDTGANSAAWCFFNAHTLNACAWLALSAAHARLACALDTRWAQSRVLEIVTKLGRQATYNVLGVTALVMLEKHCKDQRPELQPQLDGWSAEFERTWGSRIPARAVSVHHAMPAHRTPMLSMPPPPPNMSMPASSIASQDAAGRKKSNASVGGAGADASFFRSLGNTYSHLSPSAPAKSPFGTGPNFANPFGKKGPTTLGSGEVPGTDSLGLYDAPSDSFAPGGDLHASTPAGAPPPPLSAFLGAHKKGGAHLAPPPPPAALQMGWRADLLSPAKSTSASATPSPSSVAVQPSPLPDAPPLPLPFAQLRPPDIHQLRLDREREAADTQSAGERKPDALLGLAQTAERLAGAGADDARSVCSLPGLKESGLLYCDDAPPPPMLAARRVSGAGGSSSSSVGAGARKPRGMEWLDSRDML